MEVACGTIDEAVDHDHPTHTVVEGSVSPGFGNAVSIGAQFDLNTALAVSGDAINGAVIINRCVGMYRILVWLIMAPQKFAVLCIDANNRIRCLGHKNLPFIVIDQCR